MARVYLGGVTIIDRGAPEFPQRREWKRRMPRPIRQSMEGIGRTLHIRERHGDQWPLHPRPNWTGWLMHREYNYIEQAQRHGITHFYAFGPLFNVQPTSVERIFHEFQNVGIVVGNMEEFALTPEALMLFDMTDQFILELDLGEDE